MPWVEPGKDDAGEALMDGLVGLLIVLKQMRTRTLSSSQASSDRCRRYVFFVPDPCARTRSRPVSTTIS